MKRQDIQQELRFLSELKQVLKRERRSNYLMVAPFYGERDGDTGLRKVKTAKGTFNAIDIGFGGKSQGSFIPSAVINSPATFIDY